MSRLHLFSVPFFIFALFVTGCTPSQADVERSIRDEMKSGIGVTVTSTDLKKRFSANLVENC